MPLRDTQQHFASNIQHVETVHRERPFGLINEYGALKWFFEQGMRARPQSIAWSRRMANGHRLDDETNAHFLELARQFFTKFRNGSITGSRQSVSTCIGACYDLFQIIDLVMKLGHERIRDVRKNEIDDIILKVSGRRQKNGRSRHRRATVRRRLRVLEAMGRLYDPLSTTSIISDGFAFPVFSDRADLVALSKLIADPQGTTPDAPPEVVFATLTAAVAFVQKYADDIIALSDKERAMRAQFVAGDASFPKTKDRASEIAKVLLAALDMKPAWLDDQRRISKVRLAEELGMLPSVISHRRYRELFENFSVLSKKPADPAASEALSALRKIALTTKSPRGLAPIAQLIGRKLRLPFHGAVGDYAPWPIVSVGNSKSGQVSVMSAVSLLWTASYLIIASFMADRESETLAIEEDCLHLGLDGFYLKTPTFKERSESGSVLLQPCPEIVVQAVKVLQRLGAGARLASNSGKLFCIHHSLGSSVPTFDELRDRLSRFCDYAKTNIYDDGQKRWTLEPHQLRRFFGTLWVHYFTYGRRFEALRQVYDHATIGGVVRYTASMVQGNALVRIQKDLTAEVLTNVANGKLEADGPAARQLARFIARARVKVLSDEELFEWYDERHERNQSMVFPMPWGYCVWSKFSGLSAQCLEKEKRKPGIERPSGGKKSSVCGGGCKQFMRTAEFDPFWEHARDRHTRIFLNPSAPQKLVDAAQEGIRIAEKVLKKELA